MVTVIISLCFWLHFLYNLNFCGYQLWSFVQWCNCKKFIVCGTFVGQIALFSFSFDNVHNLLLVTLIHLL